MFVLLSFVCLFTVRICYDMLLFVCPCLFNVCPCLFVIIVFVCYFVSVLCSFSGLFVLFFVFFVLCFFFQFNLPIPKNIRRYFMWSHPLFLLLKACNTIQNMALNQTSLYFMIIVYTVTHLKEIVC